VLDLLGIAAAKPEAHIGRDLLEQWSHAVLDGPLGNVELHP